jgi:hypothetical protein
MNLWIVGLIVFVFNIPFGYWRANTKTFSLQWMLAIHLPVPVVIALRLISGLGFEFITYLVLVGAFFSGQYLGKYLNKRLNKNKKYKLTACLVWDIVKNYQILIKQ